VIAHGGGINGFLSDGRYYPDEDLTVIVLQNTAGPRGPGTLATALVDLVLGPTAELPTTPFTGDLGELVGDYAGPVRGSNAMTMHVTADGDQLVLTANDAEQGMRPPHLEGLTWGEGSTRAFFVRRGGRVVELHLDQISGHYVLRRVEG
jgi:hypothetical protein